MNKKLILVFGILLLMVIPTVSAAILDTSTWDEKLKGLVTTINGYSKFDKVI